TLEVIVPRTTKPQAAVPATPSSERRTPMSHPSDRRPSVDGGSPAPTRRHVLLGALAVPGLTLLPAARADHPAAHGQQPPQPFDFKHEPPRQRKSFADLTDDEVRLLCLAVGHMRNGSKETPLPLGSPLQWDQFAVAHAQHCTQGGPLQVHWSWFFLPWHR